MIRVVIKKSRTISIAVIGKTRSKIGFHTTRGRKCTRHAGNLLSAPKLLF
jgi:hypothetical protein